MPTLEKFVVIAAEGPSQSRLRQLQESNQIGFQMSKSTAPVSDNAGSVFDEVVTLIAV